MDLGATPFQALTKVIIPQIKPGIISGGFIGFLLCHLMILLFLILLAGMELKIFRSLFTICQSELILSIYALATIILVVVLLFVAIGTLVPKFFPKATNKLLSSKTAKIVIAVCLVLSVVWSISTGVSRKTLRVYNWGEYIDKTVISDFEDKFDCRIIYETFDSNEIMYTNI